MPNIFHEGPYRVYLFGHGGAGAGSCAWVSENKIAKFWLDSVTFAAIRRNLPQMVTKALGVPMNTYTYTIKIHPAEPDEGGYWVEVPALPGCVTQGQTYQEAVAMAREVIEGYLEALARRGESPPREPSPEVETTALVEVQPPQAL